MSESDFKILPKRKAPRIRTLFVCMGNICRSPAAEGVFREFVRRRKLDALIECDSAGTIGAHAGEKPDRRMIRAAAQRGYNLDSRARQFEIADFDKFDLILAMDQNNYDALAGWARSDHDRAKVKLMCHYHPEPDVTEVPDPYYGPALGFDRVLDILEVSCQRLLEDVSRGIPPSDI